MFDENKFKISKQLYEAVQQYIDSKIIIPENQKTVEKSAHFFPSAANIHYEDESICDKCLKEYSVGQPLPKENKLKQKSQ